MSKLKNSTQRFNNRLDQWKEKEKRINVLEGRLGESIQIEEPKENKRNIESQWKYVHHKEKQCTDWSHSRRSEGEKN